MKKANRAWLAFTNWWRERESKVSPQLPHDQAYTSGSKFTSTSCPYNKERWNWSAAKTYVQQAQVGQSHVHVALAIVLPPIRIYRRHSFSPAHFPSP